MHMSLRTLLPLAILLLGTASSLSTWLAADPAPETGSVRGTSVTQEELQARAAETAGRQTQARARDEKRLYDLRLLQVALQRYRTEHNGAFPAALSALLPAYLQELPRDPLSGQPYTYNAPSVNAQFYTMNYALEVGAQNVSAGSHTATPAGVATP